MSQTHSNQTWNERDILRMLSDHCDGTLDASQMKQLDQLIQSEPRVRELYNEYMFMHAELCSTHSAFGAAVVSSTIDPEAAKLEHSSIQSSNKLEQQSTSHLATSHLRVKWTQLLILAASLVGVAFATNWATHLNLTRTGNREAGQFASDSQPTAPRAAIDTIARITGTRNCRWSAANENIGFGVRLRAGQALQLAAGLVEITFDDGAKVVLEGPAKFDVHAADGATLHSGRLAAVVPQRARGFEVATTNLSIIDLGTEFGLYADTNGKAEVHVFNGLVKAHVLDEAGLRVRTVSLNTAEAVRFNPAARSVTRFQAMDNQFVRSIEPKVGPHDGMYAYESFDYPDGPVSNQNGGFGWAGPWVDIEVGGDPAIPTNRVAIGNLVREGIVPHGNRAVQVAQNNRIRRALSTSVGGVFEAAGLIENQDGLRLVGHDNSTVYISFLQRVTATDDVYYGVEFHRGDGNPNRVLCVGNGADGCGYGATSTFNAYGALNFPSLGQEDTETNFIVIKIEFGPGNRDIVSVIRNPESLVDQSQCRVDTVLRGNFAFDRISLGNFEGNKVHEVDEIRVGTSFMAVTGRQARDGEDLVGPLAESFPINSLQFNPKMCGLAQADLTRVNTTEFNRGKIGWRD